MKIFNPSTNNRPSLRFQDMLAMFTPSNLKTYTEKPSGKRPSMSVATNS